MRNIMSMCSLMLILLFSLGCHASLMNITDPEDPAIPTITGPSSGQLGIPYEYYVTTTDPQNDDIYFVIHCSDCNGICRSDWYKSGDIMVMMHCWCDYYQMSNPFTIFIKAVDTKGFESDWGSFDIQIERIGDRMFPFSFIQQMFRVGLFNLFF